jgi:hypothetical protein
MILSSESLGVGRGGYEQMAVGWPLFVLASPNVDPTIPAKWFFMSFDKSWYNLMSL